MGDQKSPKPVNFLKPLIYVHHPKINPLLLSASASSTSTTQAGPSSMTEFKLYTGMDFFIYGRNYCQNFRADLPKIGLKLRPNWTFSTDKLLYIRCERPSLQLRPHFGKSNIPFCPYIKMSMYTGYPRRVLNDDSKSLGDLGLLPTGILHLVRSLAHNTNTNLLLL